MSDLKHLQAISESNTQICKKVNAVKLSIALAIERTNTEVFEIENLVSDVLGEFKDTDLTTITQAIKKGSLGAYGRTYRMSSQEVCIWIREYKKKNPKKPLPNNYPKMLNVPKPKKDV